MNYHSGYITIGDKKLHYISGGNGDKLLLAFHGYNNDCLIFLPLFERLIDSYSFVSIDLPYHGQTTWQTEDTLTVADVHALVTEIKKNYNKEHISLLGYSMGARVALKVTETMPQSVEHIFLMAPDGLRKNHFYNFLTRTLIGAALFRYFLNAPSALIFTVKTLYKLKIVSDTRYKFALRYIDSKAKRNFLLKAWPALKYQTPDIGKLKSLLNKHQVSVTIFAGKNDNVITQPMIADFTEGLIAANTVILPKGHYLFDEDTIPSIAEVML